MTPVKFRHQNDGLAEEVSFETGVLCDPSEDKAIQSGKDDADINVILRRFGVAGVVQAPNMEPFYGDFSAVEDYQSALNRVIEADKAFMALPSTVRNRFDNNAALLMEFLDNPDNYDEAEKLGLIREKVPDPAPAKVVVENWPAPPA